jgi:chemotaxis protein MotA
MGLGTIIGVVCGFVAVFAAMIMEGGNPASLIAPPAILLITVGTFGAACAGTSLDRALDALKSIPVAFTVTGEDATVLINRIVGYAEQARRDGLLGLETKLADESNEILRTGLTMLVDGVDQHEATKVLTAMTRARRDVWDTRADFFSKMGAFAPTLGIIGTVLGLIHVLENLGGDAEELGHLIAAAFIATFFGVFLANLLFLPMSAKFKLKGQDEVRIAQIVIAAVEQISTNPNPRHLRTLLASQLSPKEAVHVLEQGAKAS